MTSSIRLDVDEWARRASDAAMILRKLVQKRGGGDLSYYRDLEAVLIVGAHFARRIDDQLRVVREVQRDIALFPDDEALSALYRTHSSPTMDEDADAIYEQRSIKINGRRICNMIIHARFISIIEFGESAATRGQSAGVLLTSDDEAKHGIFGLRLSTFSTLLQEAAARSTGSLHYSYWHPSYHRPTDKP